jgi:hypothetical protein
LPYDFPLLSSEGVGLKEYNLSCQCKWFSPIRAGLYTNSLAYSQGWRPDSIVLDTVHSVIPGEAVVVLLMGEEAGMKAATAAAAMVQPTGFRAAGRLVRRGWRHLPAPKVLVQGLHDVTVLQRAPHTRQRVAALKKT